MGSIRFACAAVSLLSAALCALPGEPARAEAPAPAASQPRPITLNLWLPAWRNMRDSAAAVVERYAELHPHVRVLIGFPGGRGGMDPQKILTAIAAGTPPDLVWYDRFLIADLAARGGFYDLTDLVRGSAQIRVEDFVPAAWNEACFNGRVYGIAVGVDARAVYYNKALFRAAGLVERDEQGQPVLGPDGQPVCRTPATLEEMAEFAVRLTQRDERGVIQQAGLVPLLAQAWPYTFGWAMDAEFMTADGRRATLDTPTLAAALDWPRQVSDRMAGVDPAGPTSGYTAAISKFRQGFAGGANGPFVLGRLGMMIDNDGALRDLLQYNPRLEYGVFPMPKSAALVEQARRSGQVPWTTWTGGWSLVIPAKAREPNEAFRFIEFFLSPEGQRVYLTASKKLAAADFHTRNNARLQAVLDRHPGLTVEQAEQQLQAEPANAAAIEWLMAAQNLTRDQAAEELGLKWKPFYFLPSMPARYSAQKLAMAEFADVDVAYGGQAYKALQVFNGLYPHSQWRPVTPVSNLLWNELLTAQGRILRKDVPAHQALAEAQARVQGELDRVLNPSPGAPVRWPSLIALFAGLIVAVLLTGAALVWRQVRGRPRAVADALRGYLAVSPWLVGFVVFTLGPILASLVLAFTDYTILEPATWAGLANFAALPGDDKFLTAILNTAWIVAVSVPAEIAFTLAIALLLNTHVRGMAFYRSCYYLPSIVPAVATMVLWVFLLKGDNGVINDALALVLPARLHPHLPNWLDDPDWTKPALVMINIWTAGAMVIIWLAGLKTIPGYLYEAAKIDGAGRWRQFTHVTVPLLSPYIFFNLVVCVISRLQIFTQAYLLSSSNPMEAGPDNSLLFYVFYLFNNAFLYLKVGYASAMAWILFVVILALTAVQFALARRWVHYQSEG